MATKKTTTATPKTKPKPAPKKVVQIKPKKEPEIIDLPTMDKFPSLRKNSKETGYVTLLQTNLQSRGYYDGKVDGKFGDKTEKAVMDFQKDLGKPLNGTVGPKTWEALQKSTVVRVKPQPKVEAPQPITGTRVLIEGLSKFQAEVLVKMFSGHIDCRIL